MKITVGISFYNAEKYLGYAIQSVLNQSYADFELLLLNDGSTDHSLAVAQSFTDQRIKVIDDGKNRGLSCRLNELVRLANGEFFARMDADDIMHVDRLRCQVTYMEAHPEIDVLGTYSYSINTENKVQGVLTKVKNVDNVAEVIAHNCLIHPSVMARTKWFVENPYDESALRVEDFELWLRVFDHCRIANIEQPLMFYREVGLPYLAKYLQSQKGERRVYKLQRQKLSNYHWVLCKNYAKCAIYLFSSAVGMRDVLIALRSKKIDKGICEAAEMDLRKSIAK